jgi:CheY-like chemotaxis protein
VRGLKAGGDDYLTKPFAFAELGGAGGSAAAPAGWKRAKPCCVWATWRWI